MNPSESSGISAAAALLVVAGIAALQARSVRGAQRHQIQELCRRRGAPGRYDEIVAGSETIAFTAASVVVVAAVLATLLAGRSLAAASGGSSVVAVPFLAGWIVVAWVLLVVVPLLVTRLVGPRIVVATWPAWRPLVGLLGPAVRLLGDASAALGRAAAAPGEGETAERPEDELRLVVDEAHREGHIEETARDMIRGVIALEAVRVSQIMTPRTQMVAIPLASDWDTAVRLAAASGHTRLPVWDRSSDDVVGILHTRDVLDKLAAGLGPGQESAAPSGIGPLLRPPWFVPESMSVQTLLREFRRGKTHMAIVTDEFGGVSGLVTIEDTLEEIVGEIADEHDEAFTDGIRMVSPDVCEVLAHVPVARVNDRMGLSLPEEAGYDTLGGFFFHQCGRVPEVGERIESHGVVLEVLAATRRRIDVVRIERANPGNGRADGR